MIANGEIEKGETPSQEEQIQYVQDEGVEGLVFTMPNGIGEEVPYIVPEGEKDFNKAKPATKDKNNEWISIAQQEKIENAKNELPHGINQAARQIMKNGTDAENKEVMDFILDGGLEGIAYMAGGVDSPPKPVIIPEGKTTPSESVDARFDTDKNKWVPVEE